VASATFSPTTTPIDPPRNEKSRTPSTSGMPLMRPVPVIIASLRPVFSTVLSTFSWYGIRSMNWSLSSVRRSAFTSSNVPSSSVMRMRSRPFRVMWCPHSGHTRLRASKSFRKSMDPQPSHLIQSPPGMSFFLPNRVHAITPLLSELEPSDIADRR
jgi:hypothetical protein